MSHFAMHTKRLHSHGAMARSTEWEDTGCQISSCYAKDCILVTGSAGAASTDRFIDITLQAQRDYPAGRESDCEARGPVSTPGGQSANNSTSSTLQLPYLVARRECLSLRASAVLTTSDSRTAESPGAPTLTRLQRLAGTIVTRCSRAQSQPAVPGQQLGRGASVDRPPWPAITRL
jgi:hypothetical protein